MNRISRDLFGMDAADDARLPLPLFNRIDVSIELRMMRVLPRDLVKMLDRANRDYLRFTANFDVATCILGVYNQQGHLRFAQHVPALLTLLGCVDPDALAVIVTPHQTGLRLTVGHQRR